MIFGREPESISCNLSIDPKTGVDWKDEAVLTYPDKRTATISAEFTDDYVSTYRVIGTKGSIRMERAYAVPKDMSVKIFVEAGASHEEIMIEPADHFRLMIDDFCKEISKGSASKKTYEQD